MGQAPRGPEDQGRLPGGGGALRQDWGGVRKEGLGPQLCMDKDMKIDVSSWFRGWDFALVTFCLPALALALSLAGHADPDLCL